MAFKSQGPILRAIRPLRNELPDAFSAKKNVARWFNGMGLRAEGLAKQNAPVLTGALQASINWRMIGTNISTGAPLRGRLAVGVAYGRRQEWEHASRSLYMYRAIMVVVGEIQRVLGSEPSAARIWVGATRGWKRSHSFNPGLSTGGAGSRDWAQGTAEGGVTATQGWAGA